MNNIAFNKLLLLKPIFLALYLLGFLIASFGGVLITLKITGHAKIVISKKQILKHTSKKRKSHSTYAGEMRCFFVNNK